MIKENLFETRLELEQALAAEILAKLSKAIEQKGEAGILFSGGSTPKGLLQTLAEAEFDWSKVKIALVDDRVVPEGDENSNIRFLQENFLNHLKTDFSFYPWVIHASNLERNMQIAQVSLRAFGYPEVAILGMGTDGHFASLFPDDPASGVGLALDNDMNLLYTGAPAPPKKRITLSWAYLRRVPNLYLHITGDAKKTLLDDKNARKDLPINHVVIDEKVSVELYWAP
jgi:6-phosphogluconolactonase